MPIDGLGDGVSTTSRRWLGLPCSERIFGGVRRGAVAGEHAGNAHADADSSPTVGVAPPNSCFFAAGELALVAVVASDSALSTRSAALPWSAWPFAAGELRWCPTVVKISRRTTDPNVRPPAMAKGINQLGCSSPLLASRSTPRPSPVSVCGGLEGPMG